MLDHERRSYAPPLPPPESTGQKPRRRRERLDVPRPDAVVRVPSPDATVPEIEEPEEVDAIDFLSVEARRDVLAGSLAGFGGGRL